MNFVRPGYRLLVLLVTFLFLLVFSLVLLFMHLPIPQIADERRISGGSISIGFLYRRDFEISEISPGGSEILLAKRGLELGFAPSVSGLGIHRWKKLEFFGLKEARLILINNISDLEYEQESDYFKIAKISPQRGVAYLVKVSLRRSPLK